VTPSVMVDESGIGGFMGRGATHFSGRKVNSGSKPRCRISKPREGDGFLLGGVLSDRRLAQKGLREGEL